MTMTLPCTQAELRALAARFATRAPAHDRSGEIATENLAELQQAGLLGLSVPRAFGGQAAPLRDIVTVVATLAQGDPSTALIVGMQYLQHAAIAASDTWPEALRRRVGESAVREGALLNALRVEPDLGTPSRGGRPATRIRRDAQGWRLDGTKIYSTGSTALRWGLVWVSTEEEPFRTGQVLVDMRAPGIHIERTWHQMGMRATGSNTVVFDNVRLPDDAIADLRAPEDWREKDSFVAIWHAIVIAALYDAVARSGRDWLVSFLHGRVPSGLGKPLATLPRFEVLLGEIEALLLPNTALLSHALAREEDGTLTLADANMVKYVMTENAIRATERAIAAIGNPALSQDNPLERHYRDVLCGRIHTPQSDTALMLSGRTALARAHHP
ncbi:acyl-CoA dehydrogenase [Novacetimonas maltaceti]|uniref:Putative acyl-CoA dehydrogenase YdbM n=1 Tax=Novacetimonas maltaceti TaxID=1203393 RepID=A0A2S3W363_9PROT|nr:acyl-CoA dehydrogenase family protein [Novacetimonas maltaceti]POF63267.1 putative acyl-CoA dehydrogenase YdbM [Novacetimonas maltaceti]PYD60086.1 acyl-CoA dehydrogenase [Novacetimonas maltaceti]